MGKTDRDISLSVLLAVHPHGRGENGTQAAADGITDGTPPRAWGKQFHRLRDRPALGTPPRAWGKRESSTSLIAPDGTPPRAWGKHRSTITSGTFSTVHPHGRGENDVPHTKHPTFHGTPPRAWGKRSYAGVALVDARYTPTGVGKTTPGRRFSLPSAVHPHGRGENIDSILYHRGLTGTPPRAWGKPQQTSPSYLTFRYTPTGVGKTLTRGVPVVGKSVHPHGRGENTFVYKSSSMIAGTPPRAWGKRRVRRCQFDDRRYTPTGVGKTGV